MVLSFLFSFFQFDVVARKKNGFRLFLLCNLLKKIFQNIFSSRGFGLTFQFVFNQEISAQLFKYFRSLSFKLIFWLNYLMSIPIGSFYPNFQLNTSVSNAINFLQLQNFLDSCLVTVWIVIPNLQFKFSDYNQEFSKHFRTLWWGVEHVIFSQVKKIKAEIMT